MTMTSEQTTSDTEKVSTSTDFKSMTTTEELVSAYNEMTATAIDLGIKKIATVEMFVDVPTGVRACEHLHNLILKTRNPKPKSRARPKPKNAPAPETSSTESDKEDETMAATAKKTTRSKARKAVKGKTTKATTTRIPDDAKITWVGGKEIPAREGSGKYKRIEAVKKSSGQTKATILKHKVARSGTIAFCVANGLVKTG